MNGHDRRPPRFPWLLALFAAAALGDGAPRPSDPKSPADVSAARALFEKNVDAIRHRDEAAYRACYRASDNLAVTGPEGFVLGYTRFTEKKSPDWPDAYDASDLQLVPIAPGVVYGTYRYRVRYGSDEHSGLSERLFLKTSQGWRIAVTTAFDAPAGTPPPPLALVGATLIDGTGSPPVADSVVLLRAGKIDCAGTRAACPVPEGVEIREEKGLWIVPGLIDAHVHFSQTGWADGRPDSLDVRAEHPYEQVEADLQARPERFFRSYLCSGVTAVFDVGGYPWTLRLPARAESDTRAPRVAAAGPLLSTIDHWLNLPAERQFILLKDAEAARAGVAYLSSEGSRSIKIWYIVNAEHPVEASAPAVLAAGEEAQKRNLPLIVHATGLAEAKVALRAGARMLVHSVWDLPVDQEFLDLAIKNQIVYCPTLTVPDGYARMYQAASSHVSPGVDDPNGCVDAETRARVAETSGIASPAAATRAGAAALRAESSARVGSANLKRVTDAGITIAMGTDAGNPLTLHGPSVYAEMEMMQKAGLTPMQVLVAATRGGSLAMRREKEIGTVEKGKLADLLLVEADPTADIANLRRVSQVVRGGVLRPLTELRAAASGK
jgi:imidazolonepropionase-like amidohydrolase